MAINKLIFAFVTLILGVALLSQISIITNSATDLSTTSNEAITMIKQGLDVNNTIAYTLTNAPTGWKASDCPLTSFSLRNASGGTAWTLTTDYTVTLATGIVYLKNTTTTQLTATNLTYASYNYCGDDYLNLSWGRTLINLVSGFFAIALLLVSVALFYSVAKESGLMG